MIASAYSLAAYLRQRRLFIGYSIVGLSMESGVPVQMIVAIEGGRVTAPQLEVLAALASALNTDVQDMQAAVPPPMRSRFEVIQGGRGSAHAGGEVA